MHHARGVHERVTGARPDDAPWPRARARVRTQSSVGIKEKRVCVVAGAWQDAEALREHISYGILVMAY